MSEQQRCRHCGHVITIINYALGPEWMHIVPAASFPSEQRGTAWRYCKAQVAEPEPAQTPQVVPWQYENVDGTPFPQTPPPDEPQPIGLTHFSARFTIERSAPEPRYDLVADAVVGPDDEEDPSCPA